MALVLDDSIASGTVPIHEFESLWIRDSAANRAREGGFRRDAHALNVTWFAEIEEPESALFDLVESIADHDSEYETGEPWMEILVFGLKDPEAALRGVQAEFGLPVDIARRAIIIAPGQPVDSG